MPQVLYRKRKIIFEKDGNKMAKELDKKQIQAKEIMRNSVVSAGAGSGKTTVLAERFCYLVTQKNIGVEQILTLTFTKKATVEMKSRIFTTLREAAQNGNELAKKAVENFNNAQIMTLDSYCASVARQGAHLYGIKPDFTQDKDSAEDNILKTALPFLLKNRDNLAVRMLAEKYSFEAIAQKFFSDTVQKYSSVANPIDFKKDLLKQKDAAITAWRKYSEAASACVDRMREIYFELDKKRQQLTTIAAIFAQLENYYEDTESGIPKVEQMLINSQDIENGDTSKMQEYISSMAGFCSVKNTVKEFKETLSSLYVALKQLCSILNFVWGYSTAEKAAELLEEFQEAVNDTKRTTGILTFRDISELALKILTEQPKIRAEEKKRFKAIMIDEFQDNNELQRKMLFLLAQKESVNEEGPARAEDLCPEKLFFVGDEKQSIYKFRGADVSVFRKLKDTLKGEDGGGNLELTTNYRSDAKLIHAFNTIFGGEVYNPNITEQQKQDLGHIPSVFTPEAQAPENTPAYEALYSGVEIPAEKTATFAEKKVNVHLIKKDDSKNEELLSAKESEAAWVASEIDRLINIEKKYKASDIAILLKTTSNQNVFERMLLQHSIPYSTETFKGIFGDGPVNDLFSYLSICVYPQDRNSYAKVLCSPFVNLSEEEAQNVLALNLDPFDDSARGAVKVESLSKWDNAAENFRRTVELSKIQPLTKTLSTLWYDLGYRYETVWNESVKMYGSLYDILFELARNSDLVPESLATFIDGIRTYQDETKKLQDIDIPLEQRDAVHIMTIHKSKGLQFPVVFVCDIEYEGQKEKNGEPVYMSPEFGLSVNTLPAPFCLKIDCGKIDAKRNYFYDTQKDVSQAQLSAELRRLAYVAFTRAEHELYITGCFEGRFSSSKKIEPFAYIPGKIPNSDDSTNQSLEFPRTIFTVLCPLFQYFSPERKPNVSQLAPWNFESTECIDRSEIFEKADSCNENTSDNKILAAKKMQEEIECATVTQKEDVPNIHISPSHIHIADDETSRADTEYFAEDAPYQEINEIVKSTETQGEAAFTFANFGTIAHLYMQNAIEGMQTEIPKSEITGLNGSKTKLAAIKKACEKMRDEFLKTELASCALASSWKRTEWAFRSRINTKEGERILKGTMDLVFKDKQGNYTIVDFKTNQSVAPEIYYSQLACYRQALLQITGGKAKIKCILYYLRFAKSVDITAECENTVIEDAVSEVI